MISLLVFALQIVFSRFSLLLPRELNKTRMLSSEGPHPPHLTFLYCCFDPHFTVTHCALRKWKKILTLETTSTEMALFGMEDWMVNTGRQKYSCTCNTFRAKRICTQTQNCTKQQKHSKQNRLYTTAAPSTPCDWFQVNHGYSPPSLAPQVATPCVKPNPVQSPPVSAPPLWVARNKNEAASAWRQFSETAVRDERKNDVIILLWCVVADTCKRNGHLFNVSRKIQGESKRELEGALQDLLQKSRSARWIHSGHFSDDMSQPCVRLSPNSRPFPISHCQLPNPPSGASVSTLFRQIGLDLWTQDTEHHVLQLQRIEPVFGNGTFL